MGNIYDIEFEKIYSQITKEDKVKLSKLEKKYYRQSNLYFLVFMMSLIVIPMMALFLAGIFITKLKFNMMIACILVLPITVMILPILYLLFKGARRKAKEIENISNEIVNKYLVNGIDKYKIENEIENLEQNYNNIFPIMLDKKLKKVGLFISPSWDKYYQSVIAFYDSFFGGDSNISNGINYYLKDKYIISLANSRWISGGRSWYACYEIFCEVDLNKNLNTEIRIELYGKKEDEVILKVDSANRWLADKLINQEIQDKFKVYFSEYPFEIVIKDTKAYIRVAGIKDFNYYSSTLEIKDYFYEIYKSRKFMLKLANELTEVIEKI